MTLNRFFLLLAVSLIPSTLFSNTLYFPQVVFGGGYSTTFLLMNTGSTSVLSSVNFYDQNGVTRDALRRAINISPGNSFRFTLPNTGPLTIGWGELAVGPGVVEGVATFDFRADSGSLITTASIPGVEPANRFVLPVDVTSTESTGIAIVNTKEGASLNVGLRLLKEDGSLMAAATDVRLTPLRPRRQIADLVAGLFPQLNGTVFKGTLVVEAGAGAPANSLAAIVVGMKEGTLTARPIIGGAGSGTGGNTLYFPQVVFGGGYSTSFVILNTGATNVSSRLDFYDQGGVRQTALSSPINTPAGGSARFTLPNTGPVTVLWAEILAAPGTVQGMATIDRRDEGGTLVSTTGVLGIEAGDRFVFPVDVTATASTGIAIANVTDSGPLTVALRLTGEDGLPFVSTDARLNPLRSRWQIADFVKAIFPQLRLQRPTFRGTLSLETVSGAPANSLAATALTLKDRGSAIEPLESLLTALPRDLSAMEQRVVDAAQSFSLALWAKINAAQPGLNVFVSPLSASLALGMTLNGAANETFDEMRAALQFSGGTQQEINDGYRSLVALLTGLDPAVKMQIANSIWFRNTFPFLPSFLDATRQYFDAEVRGLNFFDVSGSLAEINGWVDNKTNHRIPTILENIDPADVMLLINAIYFNGAWRDKFDPTETHDAVFHAANGASQPMSLMHRHAQISYTESPTYQAVDLPYGNSAFTMTVVLPKQGSDIESLAASLTPAQWQSLIAGLHSADVDLSLPKLKLSYEREFNDDLKGLGMKLAFIGGSADFTRMSPEGKNLFISLVKQKAFVEINEVGTEAAAVTVVVITLASGPPPPQPIIMRVDHPYLLMIRERLTGTILFMGKIVRIPN